MEKYIPNWQIRKVERILGEDDVGRKVTRDEKETILRILDTNMISIRASNIFPINYSLLVQVQLVVISSLNCYQSVSLT